MATPSGAELRLAAPGDIPEVRPGDDLSRLIFEAAGAHGWRFRDGDIVVLAQKIVSKSEGRFVGLKSVVPSEHARELAARAKKDPRLVELILSQAAEVMRVAPGVIVVRNRHGIVLANAGIDRSNVPQDGGEERVLLLPDDPDASARRLRDGLKSLCGADLGIVINDSLGRAWRQGTLGAALGVAGLAALQDMRGKADRQGWSLQITQVAVADEIAAAASLLMGQASEGRPVVLLRGMPYSRREGSAVELVRPLEQDLFR